MATLQEDRRQAAQRLVASGRADPHTLPGAAAVGRRWAGPAAWRPIPVLVCATLASLLVIAVLAWHQTKALLLGQAEAHTAQAAQAGVRAFSERLQWADRLLREHARAAAWHSSQSAPEHTFTAIARVDAAGRADGADTASIHLAEVARTARAALQEESTLLVAAPRTGQPAQMFLVRRVEASRSDTLLVGELRSESLWPERTGPTWVCIVTAQGELLYCPAEALSLQRAFVPAQAGAGSAARQDRGSRPVAASAALQLPAGISGPDLLAQALQSREVALAPGARARLILLVALLASTTLVVTLGAVHDRSMRRSLKQLADWARRIAAQEFDSAAAREVDPVFQAVSIPLGGVAQTLSFEQQLRAALAEVDRLLLDAADLERLARTVALRLRAMLGAPAVGIALQHASRRAPSAAEGGEVYLAGASVPDQVRVAPAPFIAPAGLRQLVADEGLWLRAPLPGDALLAALWRQPGVEEAFVYPVMMNASTVGVLAVGVAGAVSHSATEHAAQPFADRLALGFGNAVREQQLAYHASFDGLTGLPNRRAFVARVAEEEARAQRDGSILAVLLINLDRFKSVNDTLGHAGGDEVIRQAAQRLRACVRETDFLARLSGDEFGVLLRGLHTAADIGRVAAALMRSLAEPYRCGEHEQVLSASAGAAVYPVDAVTCEGLMRNADTAMHRAKESGGGKLVFFEARMTQDLTRRVTVERELRRALERDEFVLYYQPQMDVRSGELLGAEVLIRWQHPVQGLQSPAAFIDIAEQTGLIEPIGELVLRKACLQLRQWQERGLAPPRLSVNVSGRQFRRRDFAAMVAVILREAGIDPRDLELEITETLLMDDVDASGVVLGQLAAQGIRLAIDDFGTGYSSLAYLKRLRFDALKIDRSFVKDVVTDEDSAAIASAIIALARTLRKETVAEGVETREQLAFLREQRCDLIQGFLISKPVPADDFISAFGTKLKDTTRLKETRRPLR